MEAVSSIVFQADGTCDINDKWLYPDLRKGYALMEFVGFNDRNENEIYEGDILQGIMEDFALPGREKPGHRRYRMAGHVFYDGHGFKMKVIQSRCDKNRQGMINYFSFVEAGGAVLHDIQIIGNIYQNPELLE
jgi:uncharacterized phage protein (TIGR01671 family)